MTRRRLRLALDALSALALLAALSTAECAHRLHARLENLAQEVYGDDS